MSPNSEQEELYRQETRDQSIIIWNAFDEATMRTDAWSSDEEHEPLTHRQGDEAEAERMLRNAKTDGIANGTWRLGTNSWSLFQGLFGDNGKVAQTLACTIVHHVVKKGLVMQRRGPRTRACGFDRQVALENDSERGLRNQSGTTTGPCLDWHVAAHDDTWPVRYDLRRSPAIKMVIQLSMTTANADGERRRCL